MMDLKILEIPGSFSWREKDTFEATLSEKERGIFKRTLGVYQEMVRMEKLKFVKQEEENIDLNIIWGGRMNDSKDPYSFIRLHPMMITQEELDELTKLWEIYNSNNDYGRNLITTGGPPDGMTRLSSRLKARRKHDWKPTL